MIQVYKILRGIDNVDRNVWFTLYGDATHNIPTRLNQNPWNIRRPAIVNNDIRRNFFSNRVVNPWNNLPSEIKNSRNLSVFKTKLDKHMSEL